MIVIVDDDEAQLEFVSETLHEAGHEVRPFSDGHEALDFMRDQEPEIIVSDIMMPACSGFEFKKEYTRRFPHRCTPFVFLSSLNDPDDVVRGLDLGADDFLTKPVAPTILRAKIRSHLRRKTAYMQPVFYGDVERFPFVKILQFCELKGLTGRVEISADDCTMTVHFSAGKIMNDGSDREDDIFEKLLELEHGVFVIRSSPVSFDEISHAAVAVPEAAPQGPELGEQVMGRLSGIRVQDRLFQIQTELVLQPQVQVVTIVLLDGKTILKRASSPLLTANKAQRENAVNAQHAEVEAEVREKLATIAQKPAGAEQSPRQHFDALFEEGVGKYLSRDYQEALACLEKAYAIDPDNKILNINLNAVRKKLGI